MSGLGMFLNGSQVCRSSVSTVKNLPPSLSLRTHFCGIRAEGIKPRENQRHKWELGFALFAVDPLQAVSFL